MFPALNFLWTAKVCPHRATRCLLWGPAHALVNKITNAEFVELVNFLSTNLHAANLEPQSPLEGKVLVHTCIQSIYFIYTQKRRWLVEVEDILILEQRFYYLPNDDLCFPFPLLVRPDQIQMAGHPNLFVASG